MGSRTRRRQRKRLQRINQQWCIHTYFRKPVKSSMYIYQILMYTWCCTYCEKYIHWCEHPESFQSFLFFCPRGSCKYQYKLMLGRLLFWIQRKIGRDCTQLIRMYLPFRTHTQLRQVRVT